eukprot:TRINITY_DN21872_c0_g1_i12.p1 TRINITY_DN21872_c0_g1~~TRINITY_DN21872_c0_g1_i12.p1  ORF type:complete len:116 (-),score=4.59 TRINITY_DN21872_c0_g1_i12:119-466(-)
MQHERSKKVMSQHLYDLSTSDIAELGGVPAVEVWLAAVKSGRQVEVSIVWPRLSQTVTVILDFSYLYIFAVRVHGIFTMFWCSCTRSTVVFISPITFQVRLPHTRIIARLSCGKC